MKKKKLQKTMICEWVCQEVLWRRTKTENVYFLEFGFFANRGLIRRHDLLWLMYGYLSRYADRDFYIIQKKINRPNMEVLQRTFIWEAPKFPD
jgi:hypothetical protein